MAGAVRARLDQSVSKKQLRDFSIILGVGFAILLGGILPLIHGYRAPIWVWFPIGLVIVIGLTVPTALSPVYHGWMKLGGVLGFINTRIILFVFFALMVTPIGVIKRLFKADSIEKGFDQSAKSYRIDEAKSEFNYERPY